MQYYEGGELKHMENVAKCKLTAAYAHNTKTP
jgi:hypothetical protein